MEIEKVNKIAKKMKKILKPSKIYKLVSSHTDKIYISSTSNKYLSLCLALQKSNYKTRLQLGTVSNISAHQILQYDDVRIELIEEVVVNNKIELREIQRKYINDNRDICVNKNMPNNATVLEYKKEYISKYQKTQKFKNMKKIYYEKNKDKMMNNAKTHYRNNKDYYKNYYESHKDENKERQKEYQKKYKKQKSNSKPKSQLIESFMIQS